MGKRIMKKTALWLLTIALAMTMSVPAFAQTTQTSVSGDLGNWSCKWQQQFGKGAAGGPGAPSATPPITEGDFAYIGYQQYVYKLDKSTGKTVKMTKKLAGDMGFATMPITYSNGYLYLAIRTENEDYDDFTKVVKIDAETMNVEWTSKAFAGQNNCPVSVIDGRCYTGTWVGEGTTGQYLCLNGQGDTIWSIESSAGFYWGGATKVIAGEKTYAVFAADNGEIFAIPADATQDEVNRIPPAKVESTSTSRVIRSTPVATGASEDGATEVVTTTTAGKFVRGVLSEDGAWNLSVASGSYASTNNPVVVKNANGTTVFFGTESGELYQYLAGSGEAPKAVNKQGTAVPARAPGAIKGEMLASANETEKNVKLLATYNKMPGGIWLADLSWNGTEYEAKTTGETFVPPHKQFCISPIHCDAEGNLYYKNDAGYVFCASPGRNTSQVTGFSAKATSYCNVRLSWNAKTNATAYVIQRSTDGKTYSTIKTTTATSFNNTVTTGKTYYYRVKAKLIGGVETSPSLVRKVKTTLSTPKASSTAGSGKIKVTASKISGASGYVFYRSTKKTSGFKAVKTSTSRTWTNSKLKHKKTYYYRVRAYRKVGSKRVYSNYSNTTYKKTR